MSAICVCIAVRRRHGGLGEQIQDAESYIQEHPERDLAALFGYVRASHASFQSDLDGTIAPSARARTYAPEEDETQFTIMTQRGQFYTARSELASRQALRCK